MFQRTSNPQKWIREGPRDLEGCSVSRGTSCPSARQEASTSDGGGSRFLWRCRGCEARFSLATARSVIDVARNLVSCDPLEEGQPIYGTQCIRMTCAVSTKLLPAFSRSRSLRSWSWTLQQFNSINLFSGVQQRKEVTLSHTAFRFFQLQFSPLFWADAMLDCIIISRI